MNFSLSKYLIKIYSSNISLFLSKAKEKELHFIQMTQNNNVIFAVIKKESIPKLNQITKELNIQYEKKKIHNQITDYFSKKKVLYFLLFFLIATLSMIILSFRISIISVNSGNEMVDNKIISLLEENNIKIGSFIFDIDIKSTENAIKSSISELAWISITKNGSELKILTRLAIENVEMIDKKIPCNIIAGEDMKIKNVIVNNGKLVALPGTILRKGDVIISGNYKNVNGGSILRHAEGEITAEFKKTAVFMQKKTEIIKENSDNSFSNLYLDIFSLEIPILSFENPYKDYNLKKTSFISSVFQRKIPIFIRKETYTEKTEVQKIYTSDFIEEKLQNQITNYEESCLSDYDILNRDIEKTEDEDYVILNIEYTLLGDVGIEEEILIW